MDTGPLIDRITAMLQDSIRFLFHYILLYNIFYIVQQLGFDIMYVCFDSNKDIQRTSKQTDKQASKQASRNLTTLPTKFIKYDLNYVECF